MKHTPECLQLHLMWPSESENVFNICIKHHEIKDFSLEVQTSELSSHSDERLSRQTVLICCVCLCLGSARCDWTSHSVWTGTAGALREVCQRESWHRTELCQTAQVRRVCVCVYIICEENLVHMFVCVSAGIWLRNIPDEVSRKIRRWSESSRTYQSTFMTEHFKRISKCALCWHYP